MGSDFEPKGYHVVANNYVRTLVYALTNQHPLCPISGTMIKELRRESLKTKLSSVSDILRVDFC